MTIRIGWLMGTNKNWSVKPNFLGETFRKAIANCLVQKPFLKLSGTSRT